MTYRRTPSLLVSGNSSEPVIRNSIVLFGHSFIAHGWVQNAAPTADYYDTRGAWTWASMFLGERLRLLNVAGVSGDTLPLMIARLGTDVLPYQPGYCYVVGGVNDAVAGRTASQMQADFTTIITTLRANGITPIIDSIGPRASNSSANNDTVDQVNAWLRDQAGVMGYIFNDWVSAICDPTAATRAWSATYTSDNLHPLSNGAARIGKLLYTILNPLIRQMDICPRWPGDSLNMLTNSLMAGTPGAGTAASWTTSGGTASIVATSDQKTRQWQQIANATNITSKVYQDITTGFNVGDMFYAVDEFQLDTPTSLTNIRLRLQALDSGFTTLDEKIGFNNGSLDTFPLENAPTAGVHRTPVLTVPASTARIRVIFEFTGQATARVSRVGLRKTTSNF